MKVLYKEGIQNKKTTNKTDGKVSEKTEEVSEEIDEDFIVTRNPWVDTGYWTEWDVVGTRYLSC